MLQAKLSVSREEAISTIDERLYGSFVEHLGRAVYGGIYEPGHPLSDEHGFRKDVLEMVREARVPIVRYPGGNFVSGYNWRDGIGPKEKRPRRLELAWAAIETNQFGIDEFADWCRAAGTQGMIAVNLGTGTPKEAAELLEYCNHPGGTALSDLRRANGHAQPHNFRVWCLGNEMDGAWQICGLTADEYGRKAHETAKMMRWVDPDIQLVACGSSNMEQPTFPVWDRKVLEYTYEDVDYLSLHRYYKYKGDAKELITSFADMDRFIDTLSATIDYVKALKRTRKQVKLSFDEWNVWDSEMPLPGRWLEGPESHQQYYTLLDALAVGGMLCTLINHSDRVRMACLAQLVNALSPVLTKNGGGMVKMPTYYPFMQVSTLGRGQALAVRVQAPMVETQHSGDVRTLQSAAVYDEQAREVRVFALNCNEEDMLLNLRLEDFEGELRMVEHTVLDGEDLMAVNDFDAPERVKPHTAPCTPVSGDRVQINLPAQSWNVMRFQV